MERFTLAGLKYLVLLSNLREKVEEISFYSSVFVQSLVTLPSEVQLNVKQHKKQEQETNISSSVVLR